MGINIIDVIILEIIFKALSGQIKTIILHGIAVKIIYILKSTGIPAISNLLNCIKAGINKAVFIRTKING